MQIIETPKFQSLFFKLRPNGFLPDGSGKVPVQRKQATGETFRLSRRNENGVRRYEDGVGSSYIRFRSVTGPSGAAEVFDRKIHF